MADPSHEPGNNSLNPDTPKKSIRNDQWKKEVISITLVQK